MSKEKQKLHERLLDAEDAILITCEGDKVSIDILGCLLKVGNGLSYAFTQNPDLTDFFLSVISATATIATDMGDAKTSEEIKKTLQGIFVYLNEAKGRKQN